MAVSQNLTLKETEVLTSSNSSKVRILWRSTQSGESWNGYTRTAKYYVSINGGAETEYSVSYTLPQNSTTVIVDTTIVVNHLLNGTGSIVVRTWMDTGISAGVVECKASRILTTIPRATTIDSLKCSTSYVDGTITALYTPKVSTFYTRRIVSINVNGALTAIHTKDLGQSAASQQTHTLKFDENELATIYSKTPNTTDLKVRVTFKTYTNSEYKYQVGSEQFLEISLQIPLSIAPTAALTVTPVNSNSWIAERKIYVAGLSGATATLSVTPSAGIEDKELTTTITYDGATYNGRTLNVTTLKKSGNIGFSAKVTDPRGRSATATKSITVLPYSAPAVASIQTERGTYNNGWTAADEGPDIRVVFKTTLSLTANGNVYSAAFKVDGYAKSPNHGATTNLTSGAEYTVYFLGINGEASHSLSMTVTDKVGSTGTAKLTIPTIHITIEFNDSGKGIAFGKTSEKDAFECAWNAEFGGSVSISGKELDIIVEQGTSAMNHLINNVVTRTGTWVYRKWSSGILECWGVANVDVNINMTWAEPYSYGIISTVNYPIAFTELPVCNVSVAYGDDSKSLFIASCARGTTVYARGIMLCRNTKETVNCDLHYHAIGRWK